MKKTIAILITALMVLSMVPLVFAEEEGCSDCVKANAIASKLMAARAPCENNSEECPRARLLAAKEKLGATKDRLGVAKEKFEATKEKVQRIRANLQTAKLNYDGAKQKILAAKGKITACKGDESEECVKTRKSVKEHSEKFLLSAADKVLGTLEKIQERVENSDLDDAEKEEILANLAESMEEVKLAVGVVENLDANSTEEEIREAATTIKNAWSKKVKFSAKKAVGKLANNKIHGIIVRSEKLEEKLVTMIERLAEKGYDTSVAEELQSEFEAKILEANEKYEEARESYKTSSSEEVTVEKAMKTGNAAMKEAHTALKEAHKILKDLLRAVKDTKEKGPEEVETEDETESEDESEDESEEINGTEIIVEENVSVELNITVEDDVSVNVTESNITLKVTEEIEDEDSEDETGNNETEVEEGSEE